MKEHDDGGQAFPRAGALGDGWEGMSLRDYFAVHALNGAICNEAFMKKVGEFIPVDKEGVDREDKDRGRYEFVSRQAYAIADAMLKQRKEVIAVENEPETDADQNGEAEQPKALEADAPESDGGADAQKDAPATE